MTGALDNKGFLPGVGRVAVEEMDHVLVFPLDMMG
jgi:hypothetical protein